MHSKQNSKKALQRQQLIMALLQQPNWEKAAAIAGVSATTAWRISKTSEFQEEYRQARQECFSQSLARLQQGATAAVTTLLKIMLDPTAPAASRVRAAAQVLNFGFKANELENIEVRLTELERGAEIARDQVAQRR